MLAVQVQYWDLQERKRHNLVTERQGDRSLNIQEGQLEETKRHNVVMENVSFQTLNETSRHNRATEAIQEQSNSINAYRAESDRMNALTNMRNAATNAAMIPIQWYNAESTRMNVENSKWYNEQTVALKQDEADRARFNGIVQAGVGYSQVDIGSQNANTNYINAQTNQERNRITEEYNKANVQLGEQNLQFQYDRLDWEAEQNRKNRNLEGFKTGINLFINGWRNLNEYTKIILQGEG